MMTRHRAVVVVLQLAPAVTDTHACARQAKRASRAETCLAPAYKLYSIGSTEQQALSPEHLS